MFQQHKSVKFKTAVLLFVCTLLFLQPKASPQQESGLRDFVFPCQAHTFFAQDAGKPVAVTRSPDKQKQVVMEDLTVFRVVAHGRRIKTVRYDEIRGAVYAGWSPDSTQFFIMYSDGDWHVHIFAVDDDRVQELPAPQIAFEDFEKKHSCKTRDNGILFLSWTPDSQKVFLVTEVHPTSDCGAEAARFQGYLMEARTGKILQRFNEKVTTEIEKKCSAAKMLNLPD